MSGFYKAEDKTLLYGPTVISGPGWDLIADIHETYTYPVEGWYWFDSEEEARAFFGLPDAPPSEG